MRVKGLQRNPFSRRNKAKQDDEHQVRADKNDGEQEHRQPENSPNSQHKARFPSDTNFNHIKCKAVRHLKAQKLKREKNKAKKEARKERIEEAASGGGDGRKKLPHTIESLRENDETTIRGDLEAEENAEVKLDLESDEFAAYYRRDYEPKVLITYSDNPMKKTRIFGRELTRIIPNSVSLYRNRSGVKKMVDAAISRGFTDLIVINENMSKPNGMLVVHLPDGPTAQFKLSNVKITPELKRNHKEMSEHRPEVILNNFTTRLGRTVGRMLGALFHYEPEFKGRRAVTFHNQRDYIFFRHHRYEFNLQTGKARLRELGPRFTLKLRSVQHGTFDSKHGQFEWIIQGRRHAMETSRRKFFL